jgi:uncharacterized membrane protein YcaP (DUF421 family)
MLNLAVPWWELIVRSVLVYLFLLIILRITGKRQVGQLAPFDLVLLLVLSNAVQNSMNGGDNSLIGGVILAVTLILLSWAFQYATFKSRKLEQLVQGRPTLLIHRGKIIVKHLDHELLTVRELKMILRKQGIHDLRDVCEAVLESDGFVSVTKMMEEPVEMEMERNDVY